MIRLKTLLLAGAAVALLGAPAHAQTPPAEPAPQPAPADDQPAEDEDPTTVEAVVVTTDPTAIRTSIFRDTGPAWRSRRACWGSVGAGVVSVMVAERLKGRMASGTPAGRGLERP